MHRNVVVFDGANPSAIVVVRKIEVEGRASKMTRLIRGKYDGFFAAVARQVNVSSR